jgi:single-strand DNA-binding protein
MSTSTNVCVFTGYLGKDPELAYSSTGTPITKFIVAINRTYKNRDGERQVGWTSCRIMGKRAEAAARILAKGTLVSVVGALETYRFERDGKKNYGFTVSLDDFQVLKSAGNRNDIEETVQKDELLEIDEYDHVEEIPF